MYDAFKILNYANSLVSPELFARLTSRVYTGDVIDGLTVTPGTGLKVVLAPGNSLIRYGSGATASARIVSLVDNFELTIDTPDASNPRIDLVVLYVDNSVTLPSVDPPTAANLDGPGVAKAKIVKGSPAANPSAPNATAIQSSVGSSNPYTVLAEVRVDNGVSVIAGNKITDARALALLPAQKLDFATFQLGSAFIEKTSGAFSTTSGSFVSITGASTSFIKKYSDTKVLVTLTVASSTSAVGIGSQLAIRIAGTDYRVASLQRTTTTTISVSGTRHISGIPKGTYNVEARALIGGGVTLDIGADKYVSISLLEVM